MRCRNNLPFIQRTHLLTFSVICFGLSSLLVLSGEWFHDPLMKTRSHEWQRMQLDGSPHLSWDAVWYSLIAREGYRGDAGRDLQPVVFFPAYPLLVKAVANICHLSISSAMFVVSHSCLLGVMGIFVRYLNRDSRWNSGSKEYVVLALSLWPMGVFLRMGYSESLFLLLVLTAMHGMAAGWPLPIVAVIIGFATATRSVGVALLLPFLDQLWGQSANGRRFLLSAAYMIPLSCWGLFAYMGYLYWYFGDPIAFSTEMPKWVSRPPTSIGERLLALVTLEPIWGAYLPGNFAYWRNHDDSPSEMFSVRFADPIFFMGTALLVAYGTCRGWLNRREVLLSAGLLLIPYVLQSYPAVMQSHGRYASVVFPVYIVVGEIAARSPTLLRHTAFGVSAFYLFTYAAMFAAWYKVV